LLLLFTRQGANEDRLLFHGPDLLTPPGYQRTFYGFALGPAAQASEALGVTKGAASQWMRRVQEAGAESLPARPRRGATPKLTPEQKDLLPEFLSHGAEAYSFRGEVWTAARVAGVTAGDERDHAAGATL
jgi:hypothetical protein